MKAFETRNPATGEALKSYPLMPAELLEQTVRTSESAYAHWRKVTLAERSRCAAQLKKTLAENEDSFARLMTSEMGKPLAQAKNEIQKCGWAAEYYAQNSEEFLAPVSVNTEMPKSYISHEPLGPVLCIMPWNFPFWQVARFAIPALTAGNSVLLKHAEITTGCALELERAFREAGYPEGLFQAVLTNHETLGEVIKNPSVRAVTLTGSERAGRRVAGQAGEALKKTVLELGGSDPYVVLEDADVEHAAATCVKARMVNSGQSCIAAKRFIAVDAVYDRFVEAVVDEMKTYETGDPLQEQTRVGPLAREDLRETVAEQTARSMEKGAQCLLGGKAAAGRGFYYEPTVLADVTPGMPAFNDELFGPVAAVVRAGDETEAIQLANRSRYGLGAAVFTADRDRGERLARIELEAGFCSVGGMVQSDPRLPFGGVKASGYGRELSFVGIKEFVNTKTVVVT